MAVKGARNTLVPLRLARAASPSQKLQVKVATSPFHGILTPGQPVLALTLYHQVSGLVATAAPTAAPVLMSLVSVDRVKRGTTM